MKRRADVMAQMKGNAGTAVAPVAPPANALPAVPPPSAPRSVSALPPRLESPVLTPESTPQAVPAGPTVAQLEMRLVERDAELASARTHAAELEGLRPALKYIYEPGVIEAIERIRQGQTAPVPTRPAPELPEDVADMTRPQLESYFAHREEQLVARLEAALDRRDRAMEARIRASHEEELIRARTGLDPETFQTAKQAIQGLSAVDRSVALIEGYFAKNPGVVRPRGPGASAPTAPAAPAAPALVPGPLAIVGGPPATTLDIAGQRKQEFLSQWDSPRLRALAEMKS